MLLTGHKTRAIFDRYNIINEQELLEAGDQLVAYLAQHAQATPRGRRPHPAGTAVPRTTPLSPPRAAHHRVSARRAGPRARRGWTHGSPQAWRTRPAHRQAHRRPTARDPAAAATSANLPQKAAHTATGGARGRNRSRSPGMGPDVGLRGARRRPHGGHRTGSEWTRITPDRSPPRWRVRQPRWLLEAGDQLVAYLEQHAQATPRGRAHPTGAAVTRTVPPLRLVRRTIA